MYYKVIDKTSKAYKELHKLRTKEHSIKKQNHELIEERTGSTFQKFLGFSGQQNFFRTPIYEGFEFEKPDDLDIKAWKPHNKFPEVYVPNKRTKEGREMDNFLNNGLEKSNYNNLFGILGIEPKRKFIFPFLEIVNDTLVLFLDPNHEPVGSEFIEITKKEFETILDGQ